MADVTMNELLGMPPSVILEAIDSLAFRRGVVATTHKVMASACTSERVQDCNCEQAVKYTQLLSDSGALQRALERRIK